MKIRLLYFYNFCWELCLVWGYFVGDWWNHIISSHTEATFINIINTIIQKDLFLSRGLQQMSRRAELSSLFWFLLVLPNDWYFLMVCLLRFLLILRCQLKFIHQIPDISWRLGPLVDHFRNQECFQSNKLLYCAKLSESNDVHITVTRKKKEHLCKFVSISYMTEK